MPGFSVPRTEGVWLSTYVSDKENAFCELWYSIISWLEAKVYLMESQEIHHSLYEGSAHQCRNPTSAVTIGKPHCTVSESVWIRKQTCMLVRILSDEQLGKCESQASVRQQFKSPQFNCPSQESWEGLHMSAEAWGIWRRDGIHISRPSLSQQEGLYGTS